MIDDHTFITCPRCAREIQVRSRPIINQRTNPELFARFIGNELNPKACQCGFPIDFETPCIVVQEHWIGLVLENPTPIPIQLACEIVSTFLEEKPGVIPLEHPILVTGAAEQLRRIISNAGEAFCAISFDALTRRNWSPHIQILKTIADAYLASDKPGYAYWVLSEALVMLSELYFDPQFADLLELTAIAAGDRIRDHLFVPRTARADLAEKKALLEPQRRSAPEWLSHTYLCFYEGDRHFARHATFLWTVEVELLKVGLDGRLLLDLGEQHLVSLPLQAIIPVEPTDAEQAMFRMLCLLMIDDARRHLTEIPSDLESARRWVSGLFYANWDTLRPKDRDALSMRYAQLTNGRDLMIDFGLS